LVGGKVRPMADIAAALFLTASFAALIAAIGILARL
jgi:hypothetical protein